MARMIARRDAAVRYVYIRSGDAYAIPADCRDIIKRRGGEFSGDTKEWRVHIDAGADLVAAMRAWGHHVVAVDSDRNDRPRAVECALCGQPYPHTKMLLLDEVCVSCAGVLELAHPHECDDTCAEHRRSG